MRWRVLFGCVDAVGSLVFAVAGLLSQFFCRQKAVTDHSRIVLVQFDHLGDAVITTSMFGALKRRFPGARIDVLAAPWNRAVFEAVPEVDTVHVCGHNRFSSGGSLAWIPATVVWGWRLRRLRYDLAIDVRGEFPHNVLLWLTGAPRRLGWASGGGGFLLTDKPEFANNRPEVESRGALLELVGIPCDGRIKPVFHPSKAAVSTAKAAWREFEGARESCSRIVLHVGAGTSAKRWPAEHWRQLVSRLAAEGYGNVALIGTSSDKQTSQAILGASTPSHVADWTGRFNVEELAAVLQQADIFVGADSGPAHLAAAVDTPVVALFSGTNSVRQWQPWGEEVRTLQASVACSPCHLKSCPLAGHPCMRGIQPDCVFQAVTECLAERSTKTLVAASSWSTKGTVQ
jgi:heptosyltransferase-2